MLLTKYEQKYITTKPRHVKTGGGYRFADDERTRYCLHPDQRDWTQPCPICKRRVRP